MCFTTVGADALLGLMSSPHPSGLWPEHRMLRILPIGHGPLTRALATPTPGRHIQLTVFEPDRRSFARAEATHASGVRFELLGDEKKAELGTHDLIVSAGGLSRLPQTISPEVLRNALAPGGMLLAAEPCPSLFADLVFGTDPEWFDHDAAVPVCGKRRARAGPGVSISSQLASKASCHGNSKDLQTTRR